MFNTKNVKGNYEAKLVFPDGRQGSNQKTLRGGVWIFSGTTQYNIPYQTERLCVFEIISEFKLVACSFFKLIPV